MLSALAAGLGAGVVLAAVSTAVFGLRLARGAPLRVIAGVGLFCAPVAWVATSFLKALGWDAAVPAELAVAAVAAVNALWLGLGYLQFYALVQDSISLRMLVHVLESPSGSLTTDELQRDYPFRDLLERRIDQAVADRLFAEERAADGARCLASTRRSRFLGAFFAWAQDFFGWGD